MIERSTPSSRHRLALRTRCPVAWGAEEVAKRPHEDRLAECNREKLVHMVQFSLGTDTHRCQPIPTYTQSSKERLYFTFPSPANNILSTHRCWLRKKLWYKEVMIYSIFFLPFLVSTTKTPPHGNQSPSSDTSPSSLSSNHHSNHLCHNSSPPSHRLASPAPSQ